METNEQMRNVVSLDTILNELSEEKVNLVTDVVAGTLDCYPRDSEPTTGWSTLVPSTSWPYPPTDTVLDLITEINEL